jgi:heme-degrading monooxygenase HmoA
MTTRVVTILRSYPEHRAAQQTGRDRIYSEYSLTVAEVRHHREFPAV